MAVERQLELVEQVRVLLYSSAAVEGHRYLWTQILVDTDTCGHRYLWTQILVEQVRVLLYSSAGVEGHR